MNHDPVLSEREKKIGSAACISFFSPKIFYAGEITKNESNMFFPTLSLPYK